MTKGKAAFFVIFSIFLSTQSAYSDGSKAVHKVDPAVQKERDVTRSGILEMELQKETALLAESETRYYSFKETNGSAGEVKDAEDEMLVHQANIRELRRELGWDKKAGARGHERRNSSPVMLKVQTDSADRGSGDRDWWDVYRRKK